MDKMYSLQEMGEKEMSVKIIDHCKSLQYTIRRFATVRVQMKETGELSTTSPLYAVT